MPSGPVTLRDFDGWTRAFETMISTFESWRRDWPLVMQSVTAYRTHIGEQRELLKWIAAFSSAGLFLIVSGLRALQQPVLVSSAIGPILAILAFLVSIAAAGIFWWRVDLPVGRYLEAMQHRVNFEVTELGAFILGVSALRHAIDSTDLARANVEYAKVKTVADGLIARGAQQPFTPGNDREAQWLKWLGAGAYAAGMALTVLDQMVRMAAR